MPLHIERQKDMILDVAKWLYNRPLKHFTKCIMHNAVFNKMSLSSILPNRYTGINIDRIEEPESFHNSKDDIVE